MILLRVVSAMSTDETDVNIIPEFTIERSKYVDLGYRGEVDLLITKLPSRFTREITIFFSYGLAQIFNLSFRLSSSRPDVRLRESRSHR